MVPPLYNPVELHYGYDIFGHTELGIHELAHSGGCLQ